MHPQDCIREKEPKKKDGLLVYEVELIAWYQSNRLLDQINLWSSPRPISTGPLRTLLHLHFRPINQVVYLVPYHCCGKSHLEVGFTLRCFQRLSHPNVATQLCHGRDNWYTIGLSIPVLSY